MIPFYLAVVSLSETCKKKIERKIENTFFSGTQRAEDYQGGKVLRLGAGGIMLTDEREVSFAFFVKENGHKEH